MQVSATSKYVRISPYKLRPFVDVVRGDNVEHALSWLKTCAVRRVCPIAKVILSAFANAKHAEQQVAMNDLIIKDIRVDEGPIYKYFRPGAMGRASMQRRRLSHIKVILEQKSK